MISYSSFSYIVGVDEAGRGPLAGPVTVSAVVMPRELPPSFFRGLKDSKHLTAAAREEWFAYARESKAKKKGIRYAVSSVGSRTIDRHGIMPAIRLATKRALERLALDPRKCLVVLDGSLYAPKTYIHQRTIIRGDERVPIIKLASVMAKVRRDRYMVKLAARHPGYGFEKHKGYGTRAHYRCLTRLGLCAVHRRSFLHS